MSYKTYRLWKALVVIIVAMLVGWSVTAGNAFIPIPAAVAGLVIQLLIRRGVKETVVDERTYDIANHVSRATFQKATLAIVLIGATLLALTKSSYLEMSTIGFTLIYTACGLLAVYLSGYAFYSRKLGGK